MTLLTCTECGNTVSTKADFCPHCGNRDFSAPTDAHVAGNMNGADDDDQTVCPHCEKKYDTWRRSCPYCGRHAAVTNGIHENSTPLTMLDLDSQNKPNTSNLAWFALFFLIAMMGVVFLAKIFSRDIGGDPTHLQKQSEQINAPANHPFSPPHEPIQPKYGPTDKESLSSAENKALNLGMLSVTGPYMRPYRYIGMTTSKAAKTVGGTQNEAGNIVVDNDKIHLYLETEGNFISYVDIELKQPGPCPVRANFDPVPVLGALSINPSELDFVRSGSGYYYYDDHRRKLRVSVVCTEATPYYTVRFSPKYFQSP